MYDARTETVNMSRVNCYQYSRQEQPHYVNSPKLPTKHSTESQLDGFSRKSDSMTYESIDKFEQSWEEAFLMQAHSIILYVYILRCVHTFPKNWYWTKLFLNNFSIFQCCICCYKMSSYFAWFIYVKFLHVLESLSSLFCVCWYYIYSWNYVSWSCIHSACVSISKISINYIAPSIYTHVYNLEN